MTLTKLVNGLNVLKEYYHRSDAFLYTNYGEIYCPKTDIPISKKDFDYLISIGWYQIHPDPDRDVEPHCYYSDYAWGVCV